MADETLYHKIAADLRQRIQAGQFEPGDPLPSVRDLAQTWGCTPGTASRAYKLLAEQRMVIAERGRGTHVAPGADRQRDPHLAWADLVHQAEAVFLQGQRAGFGTSDVMAAFALAGARLASLRNHNTDQPAAAYTLTFCGSHDLALEVAAAYLSAAIPPIRLETNFSGSLSGLQALSEDRCQIAGIHLWDSVTQEYNISQVHRFLPKRQVALITLAHRYLGLIVAPGNPSRLETIHDLSLDGLRLVNRPSSTGTRQWLDAQLEAHNLISDQIEGYQDERPTHLATAKAVADEEADITIGIESAAAVFGLTFVPLTTERYDLVVPVEYWDDSAVITLLNIVRSHDWQAAVSALQGYDVSQSGTVTWVEA